MAALLAAAPASAQKTHSLAEDAAAFGARDAVVGAGLSPDGRSLLYLTPGPGRKTFAVISNLDTGKSRTIVSTDGKPENMSWCNYSGPGRVVCSIVGNVTIQDSLVGFRRLVSMNDSGTDAKILGRPERSHDASLYSNNAHILDWRGARDGKILMQQAYVPTLTETMQDTREGIGVDLVDTATLKSDRVEAPKEAASGYMTDGRGNVRVMSITDGKRGKETPLRKYLYRTKGSRDWKTLVAYQEEDFEPLEVDADLDSLYALKKKSGRMALYRIKLDGSLAETFIAEAPNVDISGVIRIGEGQRVVAYYYEGEKPQTIYFDPEYQVLNGSLKKVLKNAPIVNFIDTTADVRNLLLYVGSDNDPGRYYVFDKSAKSLTPAMIQRPELEGRKLAVVKPIVITAADGAKVPAYLTLPPGKDPHNLPTIVLPHGGPSARDSWDFDWLSQFLAARGYAVIQPQYRGSAGFGDEWKNKNAFHNWRTAMSDIADSARWLGAQGIANPDRIAIVGWSYGGYAALMSAETYPGLYKSAVAIAPVTDLELLKKDWDFYGRSEYIENYIGSGPNVRQGSPINHVDKIRVPVLLAHGDLDTNVKFHQSQKMYEALKAAGKDVEFMSFPGLDHQLRDSEVRTQMLTRIAELLDKTIGH